MIRVIDSAITWLLQDSSRERGKTRPAGLFLNAIGKGTGVGRPRPGKTVDEPPQSNLRSVPNGFPFRERWGELR